MSAGPDRSETLGMSEATSGPEGLIEGPVDFDPARLSAYLGGGDVRIRRISGGQSNPTYFVDHGGRALVLRKKPNGDLLPSAHQVDREYRVMAALDGSGVPAPRMVALVEDPEVIGAAFYLMERLDGPNFSELLKKKAEYDARQGKGDAKADIDVVRMDRPQWDSVHVCIFSP